MKLRNNISWREPVLINNELLCEDAGPDARQIHPGRFGSQYPRMVILEDGSWVVVYTVYRNTGYLSDPDGGNTLIIAVSHDRGVHWAEAAGLKDPGRDLDNGQLLLLPNGDLLLACRSVIWQQSYELPVYKSCDKGKSWVRVSCIDENHGEPGQLGNPDQGVYEPHMLQLEDGSIAVMYASEKYACSDPSYSQVIAEKVSCDGGLTWGEEIPAVCDVRKSEARPGMPVWDRLPDGRYLLVYEIIATEGGDIFYKISEDGIHWPEGTGERIPDQKGGPFILALHTGTILVTSNTHHVSVSNDCGKTWVKNQDSPWETLWMMEDNGATCTVKDGNVWPAMYELNDGRILYMTSVGRASGGNNIQYRIGDLTYDEHQE